MPAAEVTSVNSIGPEGRGEFELLTAPPAAGAAPGGDETGGGATLGTEGGDGTSTLGGNGGCCLQPTASVAARISDAQKRGLLRLTANFSVSINSSTRRNRRSRLARRQPQVYDHRRRPDQKQRVKRRVHHLIQSQNHFHERHDEHYDALPELRPYRCLRVGHHEKDKQLVHRPRQRCNLRLPRTSRQIAAQKRE